MKTYPRFLLTLAALIVLVGASILLAAPVAARGPTPTEAAQAQAPVIFLPESDPNWDRKYAQRETPSTPSRPSPASLPRSAPGYSIPQASLRPSCRFWAWPILASACPSIPSERASW